METQVSRAKEVKSGAFNMDIEEENTIKNLITKFNIKCCVETGTYTGCTTEWFSNIVDDVYTVEITDKWYDFAFNKFRANSKNNIQITKASSEKWMNELLPNIKEKYKTALFYLDAHWEEYWPLQDELKAIVEHYNDSENGYIIVIDDFKVPNRNYQFDSYKNQPNDIKFVEKEMSNLKEHVYFYKNRANSYHHSLSPGCNGVGKLYIISKNLFEINNIDENDIIVKENDVNYNK